MQRGAVRACGSSTPRRSTSAPVRRGSSTSWSSRSSSTNCDPDEVDYKIPGNDDAIRSVTLLDPRDPPTRAPTA
ncbi:30S ribosomal protein S2 [Yinghuangia aomiensis]